MSYYIQNLILQGEHRQLDFKHSTSSSRKLARSLVAFSNTAGGRLLIGVKDNGIISGVNVEEEYYMVEAAAQLYSKPEISFEAKAWNEHGKTVLEVTVEAGKKQPYYAQSEEGKWLAYVRVDDQNILANLVWLKTFKKRQKSKGILFEYKKAEQFLLNYLENQQTITLSKFSRLARIPRPKAEDILANLIVMNVVQIVFTEKNIYYQMKTQQ